MAAAFGYIEIGKKSDRAIAALLRSKSFEVCSRSEIGEDNTAIGAKLA